MKTTFTFALCAIALAGFGGLTGCDSGTTADAGTDAGPRDLGTDTGTPDTGTPDTGTPDTGTPDTGTPDTGTPDAGATFDFRTDAVGTYVQFDRVGMPAVSTALVPGTDKDAYNHGGPNDDIAGTFATGLIGSLTGVHTLLDGAITGAGLTPCAMTPTPGCLTQHVGGASGPTVQSLAIPDVVHLDTTHAAGFPNGRLLTDPVIDVTLSIILLDQTSTTGCGGAACTPTTLVGVLNPTANDVAFGTAFPYLAAPH